MLRWVRRVLGWAYRRTRGVVGRLSGGSWLLEWTDPLHIARRSLRQAVQERAYYARGCMLDLGCGGQPYRELFNHVECYVGLDLPPNGRADIHGDGMALPFREGAFDTVLCNEVLEHVPEPALLMVEAARVLRPGGVLLLTTPQTWGLHLEPHDFYRYTKYGLRHLAEKSELDVVEIAPTCGLWATLAQRLADTVIYTYAVERAWWVTELLSLLLAPALMIGYGLDRLFGKRGDTLDHVMVATKPTLASND